MQTVLKTVRQAVQKYDMITDGDLIAVGVSGGKDSLVLLAALNRLSDFYPKRFTAVGITVDQGFFNKRGSFSEIARFCEEREIEYMIEETDIWEIVFNRRKEKNPCSLCSRMRKGALYEKAAALGCNKVALGHHSGDAATTFYMNLLNNGTLSCFSPVSDIPEKGLTVIRPLCLSDERDVIHAARVENMPIVKSLCPQNGVTERADTENLIRELEKRHKSIREKAITAMQKSGICGW